ncbi:MAG: putative toxin-antitoxin system toxin component, PIN family [Syntrophomonadaceae bacterium]|nr:putative toxin-antitoxin system toxin component, PIN family [Syntrophomonadaceae bacterium]
MTRIVMDTNVLVSAIGWGGLPGRILDSCIVGKIALSISTDIIEELIDVISRPKLAVVAQHPDLEAVLLWLYGPNRLVYPQERLTVISDDPADNRILECAVAANADFIVSGDNHLLSLKEFRGIPILTPAAACERMNL